MIGKVVCFFFLLCSI
uniref:Uncharacterized protein n=1 Tax=Rhizophora mucronata TaxID=61149 RepID=A0A2P2Q0P1_RHIMU